MLRGQGLELRGQGLQMCPRGRLEAKDVLEDSRLPLCSRFTIVPQL